MGLLKINFLTELKYKYIFSKTITRVFKGAECSISSRAKIRNSKIIVSSGAKLYIGNDVLIENAEIYIEKGSLIINDFSIIRSEKNNSKLKIIINKGEVMIGHHSKISCERIWVRFGGKLDIGNYTNINNGSEIRCDESIIIGSYNQISYNVRIWDTNTHNILERRQRRKIAEDHFPYFGYEKERPKTKPIKIGNDCWLGENAAILKGTIIGDGVNIGFGTIISGQCICEFTTVVQELKLKEIKKNG